MEFWDAICDNDPKLHKANSDNDPKLPEAKRIKIYNTKYCIVPPSNRK